MAAFCIADQHFIETGLIDGGNTLTEFFDTGFVNIHAQDIVAGLREPCPADKANITGAYN